MNSEFSPDTLMLRDMLRRFVVKEVRPLEIKYLSTGVIEPEERTRLRLVIEQMGLWGATVPEKFGGGGLDTTTSCLLGEELGRTFVPIEFGEVPPLLYACQGTQIQQFLEPALAGHRRAFLAIREPGTLRPEEWNSTATTDNEGFTLNGRKLLNAVPSPEDFIIVFARTDAGVTAFILDAVQPGIQIHYGQDITLWLQDCRVNSDTLLGQDGQALLLGAEEAPNAWIRLGAYYLGMCERLFLMAATFADEWVVFGAPLGERTAIKRSLAELKVQTESARWLIYHAARVADRGEPVRVAAAQVRFATAEMLKRTVDLVTMIYGGPGPSPQIHLQRLVRSVLPPIILEMAIESAWVMIADDVLMRVKGVEP